MSRTSFRTLIPRLLLGLTPVAVATGPSPAQQPAIIDKDSYALPPKEILDAVTAISTPGVSLTNLSPNGKTFLLPKTEGMPSVDRVAKNHVYLAGLAFDPVAKRAHDLFVRSVSGFDLFDHATKTTRTINAPAGARFSTPTWSGDGNQIAFFVLTDDATHVAVADVAAGTYKTVTKTPVLATLNTTLQWSKDGKRILTVLVPDEAKVAAAVAAAPKVRVHRPGPNPTRTIRFLLESPTDAALLETLATGQLALVDVADGKVTKVGTPAMIRTASAAPGEGQFRVTEMKKPFSYYVLASSFGSLESVWDNAGKNLFTIQDRKLRETEPTPPPTTVATGPGATPPAPGGGGGRGAATAPGGGGRGNRGGGRGGQAGGANPAATTQPPTDPMTPPTDPTNPTVPTGPVDPTDPDAPPRPFPAAPVDPDGKRDLAWRNDGMGLSFLQLEPVKDEKKEPKAEPKTASEQDPAKGPAQPAKEAKDAKAASAPPRKDRVMLWRPPFGKDDTTVVYESPDRILSTAYSEDGSFLFLTQVVNSQRQITAVDLKDTKTTYVVHRSGAPRTPPEPKKETAPMSKTADAKKPEQQPPGGRGGRGGAAGGGAVGGVSLMTKPGRGGVAVARMSSAVEVYVTGSDRVPGGGSKPYLEKIAVKTGKKTRIFEAKGDMTETIDAVDGDDVSLVFTTKQKSDVVPDSYVTDVKSGTTTKLTNNVDRAPWQKDLKTERFRVTRIDGFKFWVKVTTPKNAAGKLPAIFWIYPREFTDQAQYDQRSGQGGAGGGGPAGPGGIGAGRFVVPGVRSMNMFCLLGYAVVEPDVPIVGPAGRMNDNYIPDLRNGLWAAIDELDKRGIIDRDRLACGGHSYGAFSTANAMAHTPFFKAGIAGDGNFNRTLTPMSFQSERRNLWDARETYLEMSPFLWANRINGALLMYHGLDDANVGTNPVNSEFLYMALDGLGKPCALYMYPGEGHGPIAKETTLDLWARWTAWLDTYVKNPTPTKDEKKEEKKVEKK